MDNIPTPLHITSRQEEQPVASLLPLVYNELRRLAYEHMARQSAAHTLQPTALVHEAWIKMAHDKGASWKNKASFLSLASTAMRHILIDHARSKTCRKRGGEWERVELEQIDLRSSHASGEAIILLVDDALKQLEQVRPEWAGIVEMKYFGGMTNLEVANALGKSESTVERYWSGAKAWLHKQLLSAL